MPWNSAGGGGPDLALRADAQPAVPAAAPEAGPPAAARYRASAQRTGGHEAHLRGPASGQEVGFS